MSIYVMNPHDGTIRTHVARSPRIALLIENEATSIPDAIRSVADVTVVSPDGEIPADCDGALIWNESERLLHCPEAPLRHELLACQENLYSPVHISCLPDVDLIGLRPLFLVRQPVIERIDLRWRIAAESSSPAVEAALQKAGTAHWAALLQGLFRSRQDPAGAIATLAQLWKSRPVEVLASLTLRNLVLLLWKMGHLPEGDELLRVGMEQYPAYAELAYLHALRLATEGRPHEAIKALRHATSFGGRTESGEYVGSGGESSYRAHWLLARLAGTNQEIRFQHLLSGLRQRPAFSPSVHQILQESLSSEVVDWLQWDMRRLARRERQYLPKILEFLVRHDARSSARILLDTLGLDEPTRTQLENQYGAILQKGRRPRLSSHATVHLDGPVFDESPEAEVNEELGLRLSRHLCQAFRLERRGFFHVDESGSRLFSELKSHLNSVPKEIPASDLLVSHRWVPVFPTSRAGRVAVMTAWEYAALPLEWLDQIKMNVDELWVPWQWTKANFLRLGVADERIRIVQPAVDADFWNPQGTTWWPVTNTGLRFLFLGDLIERTGIDGLLKAFRLAFPGDESVSLVLQYEVTHCAQRPESLLQEAEPWAAPSGDARIHLIPVSIPDTKKAELLRACDLVVLPYRSDGSGLPILRAMSCGKPVLTTDSGYARELCTAETAILLPGNETEIPLDAPLREPYSGTLTWMEPDLSALATALRAAYDVQQARETREAMGRMARQRVVDQFNWERRILDYQQAIESLLGSRRRRTGVIARPA